MEIFTLLKANLLHKKSNSICIMLLMIIVSMMLASTISIEHNVISRGIQANDEVQTGDYVVFISNDYYTEEMDAYLKNSVYVEKVRVEDALILPNVFINASQVDAKLFLAAYDRTKHTYGIFNHDISGFVQDTKELEEDEIYLPLVFKDMYQCDVGDRLSIQFADEELELVIANFIEEPFIGGDGIRTKELFISSQEFERLYQKKTSRVKMVHLFAAESFKKNMNEFGNIINEKTRIIDRSLFNISREQALNYTLILPRILFWTLYVFLFLLLIVVFLVLSGSIGVNIEMDYVNLGILKSQGFSQKDLRLVLILQFLIPAVIGTMIGLLCSPAVIQFISEIFIKSSCLMVSNDLLLLRSIVMLAVVLFLFGLFIYAKTAEISLISPTRVINLGTADVFFSSMFQIPVLGRTKAFIGIRLAIRQMTSNMKQYVRTCLTIAFLCCFLSTCYSFGENYTANFYEEMFGTIAGDVAVDYDLRLDMRDEVEETIAAISPIGGSYAYGNRVFFMDKIAYTAQIIDDSNYLSNLIEGRGPIYEDEIMLSGHVSQKLDKTIGDRVQLECNGLSKEFIISGIYDSIFSLGNTFAITYEGALTIYPGLKPQTRYYLIEDSEKQELINQTIDETYGALGIFHIKEKIANDNTIKTTVKAKNTLIFFIYSVALIFVMIVIWMACSKSFLKERMDIGIYKAYGFTSFELKLLFCLRYLLIAFIGCIIGAILYSLAGDAINATTLSTTGLTQFDAPLTIGSILIPFVLIHVFVLAASFITLIKVDCVSTRELIVE